MACFRGFLHVPALGASDCAPAWLQVLGSLSYDLTPTRGLPWVPATAAPSFAAAALRIVTVPLPLGALAVTSLSPPECLPHLLGHLSVDRASDGSNDAPIL